MKMFIGNVKQQNYLNLNVPLLPVFLGKRIV
jgi:hypothetical protein